MTPNDDFDYPPAEVEEKDSTFDVNSHKKLMQKLKVRFDTNNNNTIRENELDAEVDKSAPNNLSVHHLLQSLGDSSKFNTLHAQLSDVKSGKSKRKRRRGETNIQVLSAPLPKHEQKKVAREANYKQSKDRIQRWKKAVREHLLSTNDKTQEFPLHKSSFTVETAAQRASLYGSTPTTAANSLEKQVAQLLGRSQCVAPPGECLNAREKAALRAVSLDEALALRAQLARHRTLLSHYEYKQRMHARIKSRRFRRHLKRDRIRHYLAEFERLRVCDPEAALDKLRHIERQRALERVTLRHRTTGKWSRVHAIRSKYDAASRQALAESARLARELKQRVAPAVGGDDGEGGEEANIPTSAEFADTTVDLSDSCHDYGAKLNDIFVRHKDRVVEESAITLQNIAEDDYAAKLIAKSDNLSTFLAKSKVDAKNLNSNSEVLSKKSKKKKLSKKNTSKNIDGDKNTFVDTVHCSDLEDIINTESIVDEDCSRTASDLLEKVAPQPSINELVSNDKSASLEPVADDISIDIDDVMQMPAKRVRFRGVESDPLDEDQSAVQRMNISEAFASDDIVAEFECDKASAITKQKQSLIESASDPSDMFLPGWNSWYGDGIDIRKNKRRQRRRRFKLLSRAVLDQLASGRQDSRLGHVILNEKRSDALRLHQPSHIPHYTSSVSAYEASIRAPVGRTWMPSVLHKQLVARRVKTQAGALIPPMDEHALNSSVGDGDSR